MKNVDYLSSLPWLVGDLKNAIEFAKQAERTRGSVKTRGSVNATLQINSAPVHIPLPRPMRFHKEIILQISKTEWCVKKI